MQLGFVGTGTMGNPMACCLIAAGHQLTVYDLRREATANLCELDVHFISSLPVILRSACKAWVDREPVQMVAAED